VSKSGEIIVTGIIAGIIGGLTGYLIVLAPAICRLFS
jgi:hypothetical protein